MRALIVMVALSAGCFFGQKEVGEGERCGSDLLSADVTCGGGTVCSPPRHAGLGVCRRACAASEGCKQGELCLEGVCREACAPATDGCGQSWCTDDGVACIYSQRCCAFRSALACATFDECMAAGGMPVSRTRDGGP